MGTKISDLTDGGILASGDELVVVRAGANKKATALVREKLTASRTYYVRTDGSDSNTGLVDSAGGAFLTLQKPYDVITADLDLGGNTVTVDVGNGTYTVGVLVAGPWTGGGVITYSGDPTTPSNVVMSISAANKHCIEATAQLPGALTFDGFKLTTTGSGVDCVNHFGGGIITMGAVEYGACARYHLYSGSVESTINLWTDYEITGNATMHWLVNAGGHISFDADATLTGTPVFAAAFCYCIRVSLVEFFGGSWTGAGSGKEYVCELNAAILENGIGWPGSLTGGTTATGGQVTV